MKPGLRRLGHARAREAGEVLGHARLVDLEPLEQVARPGRRRPGQREQIGERSPLRLPGAGGALVLLLHAGQQRCHQPGHAPRAGEHGHRGDRVALVRHRRRGAPAGLAALAQLADLVLRQQRHVARHLREHSRPGPRARRRGRRSVCGSWPRGASARRARAPRRRASRSRERASPPDRPSAPPGRRRGPRRVASAASSTPTSQPAARNPNEVGSACASSVRPAIGVSRCASTSGMHAAAVAAASASIGSSARRATSIAAVSRMSWLVAPRCTVPASSSPTASRSARTSGTTGDACCAGGGGDPGEIEAVRAAGRRDRLGVRRRDQSFARARAREGAPPRRASPAATPDRSPARPPRPVRRCLRRGRRQRAKKTVSPGPCSRMSNR